MNPKIPPHYTSTPSSHIIVPISMPPNQVRCHHCGQMVAEGDYFQTKIASSNGNKAVFYAGCFGCLAQKLGPTPQVDGLSLLVRATLAQAKRIITQPVSEAEIEEVVQAIDLALKG